MSTNSKVAHDIGASEMVDKDAENGMNAEYTKSDKSEGFFKRMKHLIGRVVTIEEDWILKSDEWPYLWKKR